MNNANKLDKIRKIIRQANFLLKLIQYESDFYGFK